jgi:hypothetical protein
MPDFPCPCCTHPTLLDAVLFLAGDPALDEPSREFVWNMRALVLRGLDLPAPFQLRLAELHATRRGVLNTAVGARRAALALGETH